MLISTRGRYALRVLVDMAEHQPEGYMTLREVAQRQDISEKYLEAIVKDLVKSGVLVGVRGKGGGYRLCRPPEQINVGDVLRRMEGSLAPVACLEEGAAPCARAAECRTLEFWRGLDDVIRRYTDGFTVADLMRRAQDGNDYII
ncbi:MAG: Rrf2 family transcriptional regulator [Oscillospiraceae bacterium]|nr:Rrf2 family transcriptional regulator [Oscillospiraceae bacterium]